MLKLLIKRRWLINKVTKSRNNFSKHEKFTSIKYQKYEVQIDIFVANFINILKLS